MLKSAALTRLVRMGFAGPPVQVEALSFLTTVHDSNKIRTFTANS
jgi:hypothetical protein